MAKLRLGLFFGGRSSEHEVSINSARSVERVIDKTNYDIIYVGIAKSGCWLVGADFEAVVTQLSDESSRESASLIQRNGQAGIMTNQADFQPLDIAFPILHGLDGEGGQIQGVFETVQLPYVGCGIDASVLGLDKVVHKTLFQSIGLPVVDFDYFNATEWVKNQTQVLDQIEAHFHSQYPLIVKPSRQGSSVGIAKASDRSKLAEVINDALHYDSKIIVEKCLDHPREIEFAVLGNDDPIVSGSGEIKVGLDFYSYEAKYIDDSSESLIPAEITQDLEHKLRSIALQVYRLLGCRGLSRVDFFVDRHSDQFWINEINTMPGFTQISMYPKLIEHHGLPYSKLIDRLIELGLEAAKK